MSNPESTPDPPVEQHDDDRAPPPDPDVLPVVLAGQEEYLQAEIGRHR